MHAGGALDGLLDLVFPRRCVALPRAGRLALRCLRRRPPAAAGRPLPALRRAAAARRPAGATGSGVRRLPACRECAGRDLAFSAASAAFCYEGPARALVTACKFRALRSLTDDLAGRAAPAFARRCARAGAGARTPSSRRCPAHRDHRLDRGFDLAESFARRLARDAGLTYAPLLRRVRHGARQSGLDRAARAANVHRCVRVAGGRFSG